jgi:hypothetical protein
MRAIALMVVACTFFTGLDTSAKYLAIHKGVPVSQIVWCRFIVQFMGLAVLVPAFGVMSLPAMFKTSKLTLQLVRSVLMVATTVFNFLALQYLRLDQTVTIVFLAPLMVALLAGPFLGEWVGWRRLIAILIGFGGVDTINAGPDDDTAFGGPANDRVAGGPGNDTLFGNFGSDNISGGPGDDFIDGDNPNPGPPPFPPGGNNDVCSGGPGTNVVQNCENAP